jgi:glycosyltransferase involved in cell wall biosynthesis
LSPHRPVPEQAPVSVVIPAFDAERYLEACLSDLDRSVVRPLEVIVVDDGSTDRTAEVARAHGAKVLTTGGRHGPAAARNLGAREARGEILFFIDADVCVHPNTVRRVADSYAADPELDALIGSYDDRPGAPDFLSQYKNLMHCYTHQTGKREASTFWSGCGAVKRAVFLEHSGFETGYGRPAIEDIELGYRMRRAGRKIVLDRDLLVKHLKRWTFWNLVKTDVMDRGVPWTELILRDGNMPNDLNVQLSQRVSVALALLLVAMAGAGAIYYGGAFLTPLLALLFFVLSRYWADEADTDPPPSRMLWFGGAVIGISALAWVYRMRMLIPLMLMSVLVLGLRHRYTYPSTRRSLPETLIVGIYLLSAIGLCLSYFPYHRFVLFLSLLLLVVIALNNQFFLFLAARRGRAFAIAAIPFQLLYFFYCGVAYAIGWVRHRFGQAWRIESAEVPAASRDAET